MTTVNAIGRHYGRLTPEERFRLIVAAGVRNDPAERDRLLSAGQPITLRMPDHAPFGHAFHELLLLVFIELLDAAAAYLDAFHQADAYEPPDTDEVEGEEETDEADEAPADAGAADTGTADAEPGRDGWSLAERRFRVALASGFLLKVKADGWKLFCERLNLPPFAGWSSLPGLERLQHALKLAEQAAFVPEGMLRWLNEVRPTGTPEITDVALTPEITAAGIERLFRERVAWWGGS